MARLSVWAASVSEVWEGEGGLPGSSGGSSVPVLAETWAGPPYDADAAPWAPELGPASGPSSEAGVRCRAPGSLTGQNAEPVGMKLTLFLSGQEKRGTDADVDCLELRSEKGNTDTDTVTVNHTLLTSDVIALIPVSR